MREEARMYRWKLLKAQCNEMYQENSGKSIHEKETKHKKYIKEILFFLPDRITKVNAK